MSSVFDSRVKLAIQAVRHYLSTGYKLPCPAKLSDELKVRAGAFVSIKKDEKLRGCIGSIFPQTDHLAEEIIQNAINAAIRDPRFSPVTQKELPDLNFSVDVLTQPEMVKSQSDLNHKRFGIILKCGKKQGVLLPNLQGIESVEAQIQACQKKAGIKPDDSTKIFRFESKRYY